MNSPDSSDEWTTPKGQSFPTTDWHVVVGAKDPSPTVARAALERLCRVYWYPLYGFVRRHGRSPEEAQDLTQEFFAGFLECESFKRADQERGRFRTFLLASLKHFLVSDWRKSRAARRNNGPLLPLDPKAAEERWQSEASDSLAPDKLFEKRWAAALLDHVLGRLGEEYREQGRLPLFERLKMNLWGGQSVPPYAELAPQLGLSEGALRVAVHRLRQRYLEVLRTEVAHTLTDPAEVDEELRYLIRVMGE